MVVLFSLRLLPPFRTRNTIWSLVEYELSNVAPMVSPVGNL